jgi:hypothetical protein
MVGKPGWSSTPYRRPTGFEGIAFSLSEDEKPDPDKPEAKRFTAETQRAQRKIT